MQFATVYGKEFALWAWRCGRGWIELGHKVNALEEEIASQANARSVEEQEIRDALELIRKDARASRERIHRRIDDLDHAQVDRMNAIDRSQQERLDRWSQQLSSQINQALLTFTSRPD